MLMSEFVCSCYQDLSYKIGENGLDENRKGSGRNFSKSSGALPLVNASLDFRLRGNDGRKALSITCHTREGGYPDFMPEFIEKLPGILFLSYSRAFSIMNF